MSKLFNKEDLIREELKSLELFQENGKFYLKFIYEYEDMNGVYELTLPKVELPIDVKNIPKIEEDCDLSSVMIRKNYIVFGKNNVLWLQPDKKQHVYYLKLLEDKRVELTMEEIEKRLGYKIKIVNDKEDK